jgi:hypothetical protein
VRKVFSSQRLENVEAVAELLRAEGIAVKIVNGRSYRGRRRGGFSYDSRRIPDDIPAVWIVHSEDQPRGRQLLRELGLLESTRDPASSYLPSGRHGEATGKPDFFSPKRVKLGLLLLIAAGIALIVFATRKQAPEAIVAAAAAPEAPSALPPLVPEAITEVQVHRIGVPTALATLLVTDTLERRKPARACITVDGSDPSPALLRALPASPAALFPASACPDKETLAIAVDNYLTDGSGSGEVQLTVGGGKPRVLEVERNGTAWRVLRRR